MKEWHKYVATAVIIAVVLLMGGCARAPQVTKIPQAPPEKKPKEYPLSQIEQESAETLTRALSPPFAGDAVLAALEALKEKEVEEEVTVAGGPQVSLLTPSNGDLLSGTVNVSALVIEGNKPVTEVKFYVDGEERAVVNTEPYTWAWDTSVEARTAHDLKVVATDGTNEGSVTIRVYVAVLGSTALQASEYISKGGNVRHETHYNSAAGTWIKKVYLESTSKTSYVIYTFTPPSSYSYLEGVLSISGETIKGDDPTFYLYNWATGKKDKEVFDPETGEYKETISPNTTFGFNYFKPGDNVVKLTIAVPPKSSYRVDYLNLDYKYVYDRTSPVVSGVQVFSSSATTATVFYHLSENSFVTLYGANWAKITSTIPQVGGYNWQEVSKANPVKYIKAVDSAGWVTLYKR
jgi:hypothetical protein